MNGVPMSRASVKRVASLYAAKCAGMKTPSDLPEGWYVRSRPDSAGWFFTLHDETGRKRGHTRILQLRSCGNAWVMNTSLAPKGWGPMLYDIALEWAGRKGVMPDRGGVSADAAKVWTYYLFNRKGDVDRYPLWDDPMIRDDRGCGYYYPHGDAPPDREALDWRYVKKTQTVIPALKAIGAWVED